MIKTACKPKPLIAAINAYEYFLIKCRWIKKLTHRLVMKTKNSNNNAYAEKRGYFSIMLFMNESSSSVKKKSNMIEGIRLVA